MDWETNQRMIGLKRSLQELVLAETLDLNRIEVDRAAYFALKAQARADSEKAQAEYESRVRERVAENVGTEETRLRD